MSGRNDEETSRNVSRLSDARATEPLYTVAGAARLVGMSASTLATWAKGYERRPPGRPVVQQGPVITSMDASHRGEPSVPFVGLVEATVVQAFRRTAIPLQKIRAALAVLAGQDIDHPLASQGLYYDGARILYNYAREAEDRQLMLLTDVHSGQYVFHTLIGDYLQRISFDGDEWATGLVLPSTDDHVLRVRPEVAAGDPLFIRGGAPLSAVLSRWAAGEEVSSISVDYGVPLADIVLAVNVFASPRHAA